MRRLSPIMVVIALLLVACGGGEALTVGTEPGPEGGQAATAEGSSIERDADALPPIAVERFRTTRWEAVVVEDLGHSLTVTFTGGRRGPLTELCNTDYELAVAESATEVELTVWQLRPVEPVEAADDQGCDGAGYGWELSATPAAALGDRIVVDGHDGRTHPVIDLTEILLPTWWPEGWVERYRVPSDDGLDIAFGPDDGSFPLLQYRVAPTDDEFNNDDFWRSRDLTEVSEIEVPVDAARGAYLVTSLEDGARTVVFANQGRHHFVTVQRSVDLDVAVRFIEGLE